MMGENILAQALGHPAGAIWVAHALRLKLTQMLHAMLIYLG